jgi:hypothetical protein
VGLGVYIQRSDCIGCSGWTPRLFATRRRCVSGKVTLKLQPEGNDGVRSQCVLHAMKWKVHCTGTPPQLRVPWVALVTVHYSKTAEQRGHLVGWSTLWDRLWHTRFLSTNQVPHHTVAPWTGLTNQPTEMDATLDMMEQRSSFTMPTTPRRHLIHDFTETSSSDYKQHRAVYPDT